MMNSDFESAYEREKIAREQAEATLEQRTQDLIHMQQMLQKNYDEMRRNLAESALIFSLSRLARTDFKTSEALQMFVDGVCKLNGWQMGHIYKVEKAENTNQIQLIASGIWYSTNPAEYEPFINITTEVKLAPGECVLQTQQPHWNRSIIDNKSGARVKALCELHLQGAFGIPITSYGNVIAVAEFFSIYEIPADKNFIHTIETMTNQLGIILERQLSEKQLKRNYKELERVHLELQNTQTQLLQQSTLVSIGQLAAGVAHEINTPIQYIGDNTRFLQDAYKRMMRLMRASQAFLKLADPAMAAEKAEMIDSFNKIDVEYLCHEIPEAIQQTLDGVDHVTSIVKAMREFSHPGSMIKTPTDINRALLNTITVSKNVWKYVADVKTHLDPDLPMVQCLPNEMNQVFLNLITNAVQAIDAKVGAEGKEKGRIDILTKRSGAFAEILIKDSGIGIADGIRAHVFEPFFTTKEVGKGTGQGLSIVNSIVVGKHHGQLTFDTIPGEGTTFSVRIPLN